MKITPRHIPISALLAAISFAFSLPALGQSLALSYNLNVSEHGQRASIANYGCTGFGWVAAVAPCGHTDALGRYTRGPQREEEAAVAAPAVERDAKAKSTSPAPAAESDVIPLLGEMASLGGRSNAAREAAAKPAPDVSLRLGKQRSRAAEDVTEQYRFKDIAQEARSQKNNFDALGFELFVPFH